MKYQSRVGMLLCLTLFSSGAVFSKEKKFIVRYQNFALQKANGSGPSVTRSIVSAQDKEEAKEQFNFGQSAVLSVEEDLILHPTVTPGDVGQEDPFYSSQWHYFDYRGGIDLPLAWEKTVGSSQVVVAVLDTGVLPHGDLSSKLLPGADLVSDSFMGNDGDGRDNDASDPGDWVDSSDSCYEGQFSASSWHGTHVAGTVGAETANGKGVAGVAWGVKILPVRVLGKCGGYISDIADGIRWAAGGSVAGVANNSHPADVINLSLGGVGTCGPTIQEAIDFAVNRGSVVVVAAGNSSQDLSVTPYVPATCKRVITVGASTRSATKAYYSNYGEFVDVSAPGGDSMGSVFSTSNDGQTVPNRDSYKGLIGTSMAAPHVAGVAALIKSINKDLFPAQIEDIIKNSAKYLSCNVGSGCGSGLIDSFEALELASDTNPDGTFVGTEPVSPFPDESNSGDNSRVIAYEEDSGMCGSVAFVEVPKPPKGGLGAFVLSLCLGLLFSTLGLFKKYS